MPTTPHHHPKPKGPFTGAGGGGRCPPSQALSVPQLVGPQGDGADGGVLRDEVLEAVPDGGAAHQPRSVTCGWRGVLCADFFLYFCTILVLFLCYFLYYFFDYFFELFLELFVFWCICCCCSCIFLAPCQSKKKNENEKQKKIRTAKNIHSKHFRTTRTPKDTKKK